MDDRTFDKQTALDWIEAVESTKESFRDKYIYPMIKKMISDGEPNSILDIGCGQGICSSKIDFGKCKYIGVDPSLFLIDRAKELYLNPNKEFLVGNVYELPFQENNFDAAFSVMVWHLIEDINKAALELSRVLTNSGKFLIVTANPAAYPAWKAFYPDMKLDGKKLEGTMQLGSSQSCDILYLHSLDELVESLSIVGLEVNRTEDFFKAKNSNEPGLLIALHGKNRQKL